MLGEKLRRGSGHRQTTINDIRGPSTLRSGLVSNPTTSKWERAMTGLDDLEPCEVIGEGKYGIVHKMMEKQTGQLRVVKTVERPMGWDDAQLKMEAEILQNLDHPHILRIFSWYEDGDAVNIVMEHCEGGEVMKVVKEGRNRSQRLPEMWAATCIRQTFEALVYIHSKGIVHKDLKSANLLLLMSTESEGRMFWHPPHVVVCDLGLAEVCSRGGLFGIGNAGRARRVAGTPVTMAPEVWKGSFGPKSDVWSMGCVMFELMTGDVPFRPDRNEEVLWAEAHRRGPDWSLYDGRISREALRLNEWLLTFKEFQRPDATTVLDHVWLRKSVRQRLSKEELDAMVLAVRQWKNRNPMQRALSLKMAAGCTCLKKFASLFSEFDTDNSGILDQEELVPALSSLGLDHNLAHEIALALDVNNDGSCEYLEFAAACLSSLEEEFDELLRQEFNVLDVERKTWLTDFQMNILIDELRPLADKRGLQLEEIDSNGDGVISFSEFFEYFGRPGVEVDSPKEENSGYWLGKDMNPYAVKQLPMKQQIRIIKEEVLDSFIASMHASMEQSRHTKSSGEFSGQHSGQHSGSMQKIAEEGPKEELDPAVKRILANMKKQRQTQEVQAAKEPPRKETESKETKKDAAPTVSSPTAAREISKCFPSTGSSGKESNGDRDFPRERGIPEVEEVEGDIPELPCTSSSPPLTAATKDDKDEIGDSSKGTSATRAATNSREQSSPGGSGSQTALRTLCHDSELSVSRDLMASHQSNTEPCGGCWLTNWIGLEQLGVNLGLNCGRSGNPVSPTNMETSFEAERPRRPRHIEAL